MPDRLSLPWLSRDAWLLFLTRALRLFAYGALSVVLVFYLVGVGLTPPQVGLLLTLTLAGDAVVSLALTTRADRLGRRRILLLGSVLMAAAGAVFAASSTFWLLLLAATIGVISPSGQEVGPFLSVEQAALSHVVPDGARTEVFAWYTMAGALATALGALVAGHVVDVTRDSGNLVPVTSYRAIIVLYATLGLALAAVFSRLSPAVEALRAGERKAAPSLTASLSGLDQSRGVIVRLSALFALDAFGGGFVVQSFAAYWFYLRFHVSPDSLGTIFFWANVLAGLSALVAVRLAARIGLIRTMVVTHLPSNILLMLVPLMPTLTSATWVLWLRFSISQMDVPTRQSYVMAVVAPAERSAAGGVTGVARTIGASISPLLVGLLYAHPALVNAPFVIAGALKCVYDLLLYRSFVGMETPEERTSKT
jgi:MFS family permease